MPARVIASEQWADISVLQVSAVPRDATVTTLANSDAVRVSEPVFIVGTPYGLSYSLSEGIISARWATNTVGGGLLPVLGRVIPRGSVTRTRRRASSRSSC